MTWVVTPNGQLSGRGPPAFAEGKLSLDFSPTDPLVLRLPRGSHRPPCSAERSGYSQRPFFRAGAETRPYGKRGPFAVGAGPSLPSAKAGGAGPSHARAQNGVFQPGNSRALGNLLKGNPFTGPSEVEVSLCEKCRLAWISHQLKRPNGVGRLNRLAFNHLSNGRVLTKFQHSVPQWECDGPGRGPALTTENPCLPVGAGPRPRPKNRPLCVSAGFNATKPPMAIPSPSETRNLRLVRNPG